jgi:queuosine biosynthesis protein QueC
MDSAVTAATAATAGHELAFLHANYGQRTEGKELACFHALADHYGARTRLVVAFPVFAAIGGSSLTDSRIPVREGDPEPDRIPTSYVPFRNAHLLAAATSWGEILGARAIFVGAVFEDSSGYPDCRPAFYRAFEEAIREGTRPGGKGARSAVREDLVLLPGGGPGLRGLRVLPPAAQGVRGGGGEGPLVVSESGKRGGCVRNWNGL